jgi:predicted 3-demethylubiquinone-9 3-methyltransferase (glyoxalase superfamily)
MSTILPVRSVRPFLMFTGRAEEAMQFYVDLFADSAVVDLKRWQANETEGVEGTIKLASFKLMSDQVIMYSDSLPVHSFTFTPSISLFVTCENEDELTRYCDALSKDGKYHMPPDNYRFSTKFAWVDDRFGVSWQVNLP